MIIRSTIDSVTRGDAVDLCSVADLVEEIGSAAADDTALLSRLVREASAYIAEAIGQPLGRATVRETFEALATRSASSIAAVTVTYGVNTTVTGIEAGGTTVPVVGVPLPTPMIRAPLSAPWYGEWYAPRDFPLVVRYSTGWDASAGLLDVPEDLRRAAIVATAQQWWSRSRDPDARVTDISGVISTGWDLGQLPRWAFEAITRYRRVMVL